MNMNQTRLDDRCNSLLAAVAVFCVVGASALTMGLAPAGADAVATARAAQPAPIVLPTVYLVAQR